LGRCCKNRRKAVPYVTTEDWGRNRIIPGPLVAPLKASLRTFGLSGFNKRCVLHVCYAYRSIKTML